MIDHPAGMPPEALAAARLVIEALHQRLVSLAADLPHETPIAVDLREECDA
jgi:hypothetical protein